jgi:hypothetical protein
MIFKVNGFKNNYSGVEMLIKGSKDQEIMINILREIKVTLANNRLKKRYKINEDGDGVVKCNEKELLICNFHIQVCVFYNLMVNNFFIMGEDFGYETAWRYFEETVSWAKLMIDHNLNKSDRNSEFFKNIFNGER